MMGLDLGKMAGENANTEVVKTINKNKPYKLFNYNVTHSTSLKRAEKNPLDCTSNFNQSNFNESIYVDTC